MSNVSCLLTISICERPFKGGKEWVNTAKRIEVFPYWRLRWQKGSFSQQWMYAKLTLYLLHGGLSHFSGCSGNMMKDLLILLFE